MLGESVSFEYKGSSSTQSSCGSLMSLLCVLILLVYLGNAITMVVFGTPGIVS
jgi:hypothetical protein